MWGLQPAGRAPIGFQHQIGTGTQIRLRVARVISKAMNDERVCFKARLQTIFKHSARTAKKTQHFTISKISGLTLFREIIAISSENHMKSINTLWGQNEELIVEAGGNIVTIGLHRVNVKKCPESWTRGSELLYWTRKGADGTCW
jgi:hypothetical protein